MDTKRIGVRTLRKFLAGLAVGIIATVSLFVIRVRLGRGYIVVVGCNL